MRTLAVCGIACVMMAGAVFASLEPACAQSGSSPGKNGASEMAATGKVLGPNLEPQAGVPVMIEGPLGKTHAFTDANGNWSLYNLTPGTYQVQPAPGAPTSVNEPVVFTVKDKGVFGKLFGSQQDAIYTSDIKLTKIFKQ